MAAPLRVPAESSLPLVGREREQAALRDYLTAALAGRGGLVLLGGEAGIGKTALAEWLCAEASAQGALVLVGRCYDLSETPPYGPWGEALARAPAGDALPILPAAVLPPESAGAALAGQEAIARRVCDYLATLAAQRPVVLLLEDLHWADPASLDLLRVVARGLSDLSLLLLATYRADEVGRSRPLHALLPALVREARAARLNPRPLAAENLRALVRARHALAPADEDRLVGYLGDRTEGNPLYTGEVLRSLAEAGLLPAAGRGGGLGDLDAARVPTLLRQVIDGRAARLGDDARDLLTVAAVLGQNVPLALWAAVSGADEDALVAVAEAALAAGLLAETPDGAGVRFAHALIREALYEGTSALRRPARHRRAAEALAATPAPDPDAVAYHFQRAGDPRAAAWLVRAGEQAERAYAWLMAAERFAAAAALDAADAGAYGRERLLFRSAWLRRHVDPHRALAALGDVTWLAEARGDRVLAALATVCQGILRCMVGQLASGIAALQAGLAALEAAPPLGDEERRALGAVSAEPHGPLVLWLGLTGRFAEADTLGAAVTARAAPPDAAQGLALARVGLACRRAALGQPEAARHLLAAARREYRATNNRAQIGMIDLDELLWVALPYAADRVAERRHLAAAAAAAWGPAGVTQADPLPRRAHLPLLVLEGAWDEARTLAQAMRGAAQGLLAAALVGPVARAQGARTLARACVGEHFPAGPATAPGDILFFEALPLQRLAALLALDDGDHATARAWLEAHDRWLGWSGAVLGRAEGHLGWAAYHRAAGDLVAARECAEAALAHASDPRQPLALLAAHRLLGELDTAAGQHTAGARHLREALTLAEACAAPYERALTLLALADLHAPGDRDAAQATLAEAVALLAPLDARPALARADALAARLAAPPTPAAPAALPFGLTAREAEVLHLLAEGLTDPQIAARLFVSRHTVNAHTRAIYGKLGVTTRAAATRLAGERGLP